MQVRVQIIQVLVPFFLLLTLSASGQLVPRTHPLHKEIEKIIFYDTGIRYDLVPGILIGVIDGDSSYMISLGQRSFEDTSSLLATDIFEVGSLAKVATSATTCILDSENKISINTPVSELMKDQFNNSNIGHLTIRELLNHQTGLPKLPAYIGMKEVSIEQPYATYTKAHLTSFLQEVRKPGLKEDFLYSHINYALLELILEQHLQDDFADIVEEILFESVGMAQTGFESVSQEITPGFTLAGNKSQVRTFASFAAAEGMHSSLSDLMKFLRWSMQPENSRLCTPDSSIKSKDSRKRKIRQMNGWFVDQPGKKHSMYLHTGKSNGHHALMAFVSETQTGVIVLANSAHGTQDLGPLILRMLNQNWKRKPTKK